MKEAAIVKLVNSLNDAIAMNILIRLTNPRNAGERVLLTEENRSALRAAFQPRGREALWSDGDAARAALCLLAHDARTAEQIQLLAFTDDRRFDAISTVMLAGALLLVLQTHFRFERTAQGKVTVLIEKRSTKDSLLKPLIEKLLSFIPEAPSEGPSPPDNPQPRD